MNVIIESTLKTLKKAEHILSVLDDSQLSNTSIPPYHSSIGSHIRHILDFYDCIFNINTNNQIDLTERSRNKSVECECDSAKDYLETIKNKIINFNLDLNGVISVFDDLGSGKTDIKYTFGALFSQANSHTIHHYAIINYILEGLKVPLEDENFGYNPTTPKLTSSN